MSTSLYTRSKTFLTSECQKCLTSLSRAVGDAFSRSARSFDAFRRRRVPVLPLSGALGHVGVHPHCLVFEYAQDLSRTLARCECRVSLLRSRRLCLWPRRAPDSGRSWPDSLSVVPDSPSWCTGSDRR